LWYYLFVRPPLAGVALPAVHPRRGAAGKARGVDAAAPMNC
jgi:hypothetical protein